MKISDHGKSGQVVIYLLLVLVALLFLVLLNVDTFLLVRTKNRAQNAGDASALAAARGQAAALNEIGRLNLEHAALACRARSCELVRKDVLALAAQQARLAFSGPVDALAAAQNLAHANKVEDNPKIAGFLAQRASFIAAYFDADDERLPFPGANRLYAALLGKVIDGGIAAGPDNMDLYGFTGNHLLFHPDFYEAVAGRNWCWFKHNAAGLLKSYSSWHDWGRPEGADPGKFDNSEVFPLSVERLDVRLADYVDDKDFARLARHFGFPDVTAELLATSGVTRTVQPWYFLKREAWGPWTAIAPDGEFAFPATGRVKPEYDVNGAAAMCRVEKTVTLTAKNLPKTITWTAAAKPLGTLPDENDAPLPVTAAAYLVLPAFDAVRLVPVDAAAAGSGGTADVTWMLHVRDHVHEYLANGPLANSCPYCQSLRTWENPEFRESGRTWLELYGNSCKVSGGGGRGHGGSRRGH